MSRAPVGSAGVEPVRQSLAVLISWTRWAGVVLGLGQSFLVNPDPYPRAASLGLVLAVALYNLPAALARRLTKGATERVLLVGFLADCAACAAWLFLHPGDRTEMIFLVYVVVAIEAAVLYRWRGAAVLTVFFLAGLGRLLWEQPHGAGDSFPAGMVAIRSIIVLVVAAFAAAIASESHRARSAAGAAGRALDQQQRTLQSEARERRQAEQALRVTEERLRAIVRSAPVMLFAFDREGVITFSEGSGLAALGRTPGESVGWSVQELYANDAGVLESIRQALSGRTVHATAEEAGRAFAVSYGPLRDGSGDIAGGIGVALDISDRRQAERALHEQTRLYETLLRAQSDLGDLVVVSEGGRPVHVNQAVVEITGYREAELLARESFYDLVPAPDRTALHRRLDGPARAGQVERFETVIRAKDGHLVELEAAEIALEMGERTRIITIARDITDRKRIEEERRLLLGRLVSVQEEQRRRIANDIHDDSIQAMYAVKIRLHLLRAQVKDGEQLKLLSQLDITLDHAITRLRHLLFELRPVALDREGLVHALRLYLEDMHSEAGPDFSIDNRLDVDPPEETSVIIYRVAQEALANVRKHARATRVEVALEEKNRGILVGIRDNGKGFSANGASSVKPGHLGLAAMRERTELAGGWLHLESTEGAGTSVEFWIPREPALRQDAA